MINYLKLINRYWQEVDVKGFTPLETNIYFRLLDICNRLGHENPFSLSNPRAVALMALTKNTLIAGRDKLVMKGLIGFKGGSRRKDVPMYCFPEEIDGQWVFPEGFDSVIGSNFDPKPGPKPSPKSIPKSIPKPSPKSGPINKIKSKRKNNLSQSACACGDGEGILFSEEELPDTPKGISVSAPAGFVPPLLGEVIEHFRVHATDPIDDPDTEARVFFNYYDSQEWTKSNGRRVSNWQSLANDWILRHQRERKQAKANETTAEHRRTTPEDTLAAEQSKLADRITLRTARAAKPTGGGSGGGLPF